MALQGGSAPTMLGRVVGKHTDSCVVPASLKGVSVQNNVIPNTEDCQERKPWDRGQGTGDGTGRGGPGKFQAVSIRGLLPALGAEISNSWLEGCQFQNGGEGTVFIPRQNRHKR